MHDLGLLTSGFSRQSISFDTNSQKSPYRAILFKADTAWPALIVKESTADFLDPPSFPKILSAEHVLH